MDAGSALHFDRGVRTTGAFRPWLRVPELLVWSSAVPPEKMSAGCSMRRSRTSALRAGPLTSVAGVDERFDLYLLSPSPERVTFDRCPVCLSTGSMTAEHVPPEAIGGRVMTSTCDRCNHELGSLVDRPFVDSMFGRFGNFKLSTEASNGVKGFRSYRNVRLAGGRDHDRAVWIDGEKNSDLAQLLAGATQFEAKMQIPDPKAVGLGELKNLYLACCVIAGEILSGETAERVRTDLVAVRDNRTELADGDVVDVTQWVRHVQPFEAEVTKPGSRPIYQAAVARDGRLIPAAGWRNYTCESPFSDSLALSARLAERLRFV